MDNCKSVIVAVRRIRGVSADGWLLVELADGTEVRLAFMKGRRICCKWPENKAVKAWPVFRCDGGVMETEEMTLVGFEFVKKV